ncbi:hypothetical protein ACLQ29_31810 [Micromonospora sp. DT228]|uniref:hypothetical protein n=1 Tax=Micromonospora sp. DT228 TaxID=3393443 RepID=UPI003CE98D00
MWDQDAYRVFEWSGPATSVELRGDLTAVMDRLYGQLLRAWAWARGRGDMLRQRPTESQAMWVRHFEGRLSDLLAGQK